MTGKTQAARQPSIDDLLASIRQAIHERVAPGEPGKPTGSPPVAQARPPARPETGARRDPPEIAGNAADASRPKRTLVTSGHEGFAGLLGGDVRLEEALARLNHAGWRRDDEPPVAAAPAEMAVADEPPVKLPKLRPTIDEWTGAPASRSHAAPINPAPPIRPFNGAKAEADASGRKTDTWDQRPQDQPRTAPRAAERPGGASSGAKTSDLLSSETASAANSAFNRLAETLRSRDPGAKPPLDEVTRELKPLLKAWLDENLPGIVERLVREEIERVARPGR